jgi:hypothetical protein
VGIALVVFRLAAMDRLHVQGMTEDEREAFIGAPVSQPVPGEHALDGDDNPQSIRGNDVQEGLRTGLHIAVHQDLAVLVEDADVHRPGVQVDAAVKWVLSGVQSHEVSSFLVNRFFP